MALLMKSHTGLSPSSIKYVCCVSHPEVSALVRVCFVALVATERGRRAGTGMTLGQNIIRPVPLRYKARLETLFFAAFNLSTVMIAAAKIMGNGGR